MKNWEVVNNTLQKEFVFKNFTHAITFVNKVAELSESVDHHPDILIHDYKKITFFLTTHSQGGMSEKDYTLAAQIDKLFVD